MHAESARLCRTLGVTHMKKGGNTRTTRHGSAPVGKMREPCGFVPVVPGGFTQNLMRPVTDITCNIHSRRGPSSITHAYTSEVSHTRTPLSPSCHRRSPGCLALPGAAARETMNVQLVKRALHPGVSGVVGTLWTVWAAYCRSETATCTRTRRDGLSSLRGQSFNMGPLMRRTTVFGWKKVFDKLPRYTSIYTYMKVDASLLGNV